MRIATEIDKEIILEALKKDLGNCLYIYMDICKYGLQHTDMRIWFEIDMNGCIVIMKYYDSLQIYANKRMDNVGPVIDIINENHIQSIFGPAGIVDWLFHSQFFKDKFQMTRGNVFKFLKYRKIVSQEAISRGSLNETNEIAQLMCMDEGFAQNYESESLANQLRDRMVTGMGRNYVIHRDGKIIAHIATFAEGYPIAVTSGLIVHPEYRSLYPYGTLLESFLVNELQQEGYEVYTFVNESKRIKLLQALGCEKCGEYAKLTQIGE